nr:phenylalanine--tRNA ligase subunit beta [Flavobacteriales bacterium]
MRISWNWLTQYVEPGLTPQQAAAILTSTGLECESVELHEPIKGMLAGVVVGHVLECRKHPDADRLSVTLVDLGSGEPVQIVCGAPNVAAGQKVLVATVGANLCMSDGTCIIIKKSKIRGQESHGMICAEDELGLGQSHDGILVLDPAAAVGTPAAQHLGLHSDHVLEIGLTPNRTDALGHVGVARDLIAALNHRTGATLELKLPDVSAFAQDDEARTVPVEVQDAKACPRYAGLTLTGIRVGPSPKWLQDRLTAIGLKPINNVVDVTNYVQHELGQPLHAFDADQLEGGRIVVRPTNDFRGQADRNI